jgi:hypothetical protein
MQPSPYTPGEVARAVPGRATQLTEFDERISTLVDLRRLVGRIRVDHAARGVGKTSLLREFQRRAEARGVTTLWVTAGEPQGLIAQICEEAARASDVLPHGVRTRLLSRIDSLQVTVGVPGVAQVSGDVRSGRRRPDRAGSRSFEELIRATASIRRGAALFIDEIQSADPDGIRTLVYAWQHLQAEGQDVPAAVFAAGLPGAPEAIASVVTFSERIAYRPLGRISREAEAVALIGPASTLGVEWTPDAIAAARDIAKGFPYLVQLVADAAWTAAGRPDPGGHIAADAVAVARDIVRADLDALFRARWSGCTGAERRLLSAMAADDGPAARADIARALDVHSDALSAPRARLIDKGLIEPVARGMVEFTIPGFAEFVREGPP